MDQDVSDYKCALAAYPTGICVVTAQIGAAARGITVNSFASVSLKPKLVSWCIGLESRAFGVFSTASHFNVHILKGDERALAERFADFAEQDIPAQPGQDAPVLNAGLARLHCVVRERLTLGDHLMLVGEVTAFERSEGAAMSYYHGHYDVMD